VLAATLPTGQLLRLDVAPVLFAFVLLMLLLVATGRRKPRERREWRPLDRAGWRDLAWYVLTTALAGFTGFLAIVLVFYVLVAHLPVRTLWQAFTGGGLLVLVVAAMFFALTALEDRVRCSRRREGEGRRA